MIIPIKSRVLNVIANSPKCFQLNNCLAMMKKEDLTCNGIEKHQVLKVGDLPSLPALSHIRGLEELTRGGQRNPPAKKST